MFDKRKLKKENKKLLKQNETLQETVNQQRDEINRLKTDVTKWRANANGAGEHLRILKAKLRDQTAADLLLSSFKLLHKIIRGEEPSKSELAQHQGYQQQLAQMASSQKERYPGSGLLGGLF